MNILHGPKAGRGNEDVMWSIEKRLAESRREMRRERRRIIAIYLVASILLCALPALLAANIAQSGGLKPIVERLWCGAPGCLKDEK